MINYVSIKKQQRRRVCCAVFCFFNLCILNFIAGFVVVSVHHTDSVHTILVANGLVIQNTMQDVAQVQETTIEVPVETENVESEDVVAIGDTHSKEHLEAVVVETGIMVDTDSVPSVCSKNETLDASSLKVMATLSDNSVRELNTSEYTVSNVDTSTYGTKDVTITYKAFTCHFSVNVAYTVTPISKKVQYVSCSLNLRKGPGTNYESIGCISYNDAVTVKGTVDDTWVQVVYHEKEGFCSSKHLMNEQKVVEQTSRVQTTTSSPYDNVVVGESGTNSNVVSAANQTWNTSVPDSLKKSLIDNGWTVSVSKESLANRFGYDFSVAGITCYGTKEIFLDNRKSCTKASVLLHECGHAISCMNNWASATDEWASIYASEKQAFFNRVTHDEYDISSQSECFASAFGYAILKPSDMKKYTPKMYEYVSRYM